MACLPACQRRLVERAGGEVQAHADGDQREAEALVGVVVVEDVVEHERPDRQQPDRDGDREGDDCEHGQADRARERLTSLRDLQTGQVGEQRGLDRLEELQRCARDQQHVENDAGQLGSGAVRRGDRQHRGVQQRLLRQLDPRDRDREATPAADREIAEHLLDPLRRGSLERGVGSRQRAGLARRAARERRRHDHQRDERRSGDAERDRRLPVRYADGCGEGEGDP